MFEYAVDMLSGVTLGNYRLERQVGASQGGPIFLARADAGATTYLLHFLAEPTKQGADKRHYNLERFQYLVSQMMSLQHPSILPLLDYGTYQGIPYLVSPNLTHNSLRRHLTHHGPINAFTVGRYLDQIAVALDYAHKHGVFHGHLTLDCIFIRPDRRLVLADFGVRSLLELNASGKLLFDGSEACAPEQLLGKPTDPASDVYALGSVLYQLLTGLPVFAGTSSFEVIQQHLFATVPPLGESRSDLPGELDSILGQALAKDPKQRYQQAGALANAYHQVVDPYNRKRVPFVLNSSPAMPVQRPFVPGATPAEAEFTDPEWSSNGSVFDRDSGIGYQGPQTPLSPVLVDISDDPTLKRIPAVLKQTPLPSVQEDVASIEFPNQQTLLKQTPLPPPFEDVVDVKTLNPYTLLKQTPLPPPLENVVDVHTLNSPSLLEQTPLPPTLEDVAVEESSDLRSNPQATLLHRVQQKHTWRTAMIAFLLVLIASGTVGAALIFRQSAGLSGFPGLVTFFANSKILLGLCIALSIGFFVAFNIISRVSLSTTRHEYAYTVLWQFGCALLVPFFLPFDRFSISISPQVLLLVALSVVLWALVDVFQFSAFKYEEASVLSGIFPLNFVFTFLVSVVLFHSVITPTVVVGFLIIMAASLLIGGYHTGLRLSKGVVFALLCSFFRGVVLGFNSEVVKSFSIGPNMFVGFLFPALVSLLILLRPKKSELRYELQVQWKKILLNAAVLDVYYFFLLKAFQLGNTPQVVALSASSTLLTALAGIVILKEDKHKVLKISVAALATLGVILVQL